MEKQCFLEGNARFVCLGTIDHFLGLQKSLVDLQKTRNICSFLLLPQKAHRYLSDNQNESNEHAQASLFLRENAENVLKCIKINVNFL